MPQHLHIRREDRGADGEYLERPAPPPAVFEEMPGQSEWWDWHGAEIHFHRAGIGPPLLLVHMVDVGASCIEWRRNLDAFAEHFETYAVDLPGFGLSGPPEDAPREELYERFLSDFVAKIRMEHGDLAPAAIGSGTGGSYLAAMSVKHPGCLSRLAVVVPTGISTLKPTPLSGLKYHALHLPIVHGLATTVSTRTSILEHLKNDVYGDDGCAGMAETDARYFVAHRPGIGELEMARIAGLLHVDLTPIVPKLRVPTMLIWGRKATSPPIEDVGRWEDLNAETRVKFFELSGQCPHFEEADKFNEVVSQFLAPPAMAQAA